MSPRPRTTLIIAVIAQAAVSVVQFGLPAIGVEIQNKFGLGPAGFGAVFAAVGLGSAVALIPAGMLVDRFGARPVLLIGAAINLCAYLAASVAPNAALFAAAIFLAGIGSSAVPVAGMSSLLREFPPERRGIALGWRQLAVPMGGAIGAAALPLLAHVGGVRLALIVTAFATASTASVFAWLSAAGGGTARRMRLDGALTARGMRPLLVVGLLYVYALGASLTYIVAAARDDGLGKAEAGALFVVLNLSAAASRLVWGRMADRGGGTRRVRTLIECGVLAAVAGLAMAPVLHVGFAAGRARHRRARLRLLRLERRAVRHRRRAGRPRPGGTRGGRGIDHGVRRRRAGRARLGAGGRARRLRRDVADGGGLLGRRGGIRLARAGLDAAAADRGGGRRHAPARAGWSAPAPAPAPGGRAGSPGRGRTRARAGSRAAPASRCPPPAAAGRGCAPAG